MPVVSVHILYVGDTAYDLRKVSSIVPHPDAPLTHVLVRFQDDPRLTVSFDRATFEAAWTASLAAGGGGGGPTGPASGDLGGTYPAPLVVGIQNTPVASTAPTSGAQLVYNAVTAQYEIAQPWRYFVSGAAAVAAAPFIDGTFVVIAPGSPSSEAGTYQVVSNGGASFPADYALVSDATDTAAEVGIVDAGNYFAATDVEGALQELASGAVTGATGVLPVGTTVIATTPVASEAGVWSILLENGVLRYKTMLSAVHDGGLAHVTEFGSVPGPGVGVVPVTFDADISGGNLRILAQAASAGWSYRIRSVILEAV